MKWFKIGLLTGLIIATIAGFTFMKSSNKGYKYYYYPELNAYYDVQNETYIYSIDGAKTWDTITKTSEALPNSLGKKIIVYSPIQQVWLQNEEHRKKYDGMLNDLIGTSVNEVKNKKNATRKNEVEDSNSTSKTKVQSSDSIKADEPSSQTEIEDLYLTEEKPVKKKVQMEREVETGVQMEEVIEVEQTSSDSTEM